MCRHRHCPGRPGGCAQGESFGQPEVFAPQYAQAALTDANNAGTGARRNRAGVLRIDFGGGMSQWAATRSLSLLSVEISPVENAAAEPGFAPFSTALRQLSVHL
jgi:hypothetical protein